MKKPISGLRYQKEGKTETILFNNQALKKNSKYFDFKNSIHSIAAYNFHGDYEYSAV